MIIFRFSLKLLGLAAIFGMGCVAGGLMLWKVTAERNFPAGNTEIGKIFRMELRRGSDRARAEALRDYLRKISADRSRVYRELSEANFVTRYDRPVSKEDDGGCVQFVRQDDRFFDPIGYWNVSFCGGAVNVELYRPSL
jgi:hypothetical protein